jgi:hypothetical protein
LDAEPSVGKALRAFFRGLIDDLDNPKKPHVCLMARSLSSDVLDEAELGASVKSGMRLFEERISARLERAKGDGELPSSFQTDISAQIIFTFLQGYFRVVKVLKPREEMWRQIEVLLGRLGL